jgi:transposase-like protein
MTPREPFTSPVPGLVCPLCLSKSYTVIARRDPERGIPRSVYVCGDCKSHFGDAREGRDEGDERAGN